MPEVGHFSAWITVDGIPLEEYAIQVEEETNTVTCWIPSEAGKAYKVHWNDHHFQSPTSGRVHVDGHNCGASIISGELATPVCREGMVLSPTSVAPYAFSTIRTSDDDTLLSVPTNPDMGLIKITIHNVQIIQDNMPFSGDHSVPALTTFHEKTKKGISHQTSFHETTIVPKRRFAGVNYIGEPVAVFHFRYRPLALLQAQDIAPRSPSAQPLSASPPRSSESRKRTKIELDSDGEPIDEIDEDDSEDEDAKQLAELQKQMDTIRAKHKDKERPRKKIKREPIVGVTVDLTVDD
ncbi:hypothetical protein E1B28_010996 [Marasmius oreades]|uniref:DUF7918 domain-containing protein n=1 Tax=Marasmius oreades TaxID=181124 RepID=A0A9P7UPH6_9AGAR|nr:uncharacterized protein E1B28_010996 [Marasmius oreades]KAG7089298.1 hypothetical protein E1B28_010996 [Marasmius oreades]